jgi:hypothetical protein
MAFLNAAGRGRRGRGWIVAAIALVAMAVAPARAAPNTEYSLKAVFLFNFAQFVTWPPEAFGDSSAPLIVGVLGEDPFDGALEEAVRGEKINGRPIVARHFARVEDIGACHILFISDSENRRFDKIVATLAGRSVLTVGEDAEFMRQGGIIRFVTDHHRIRLRINLEAARAAHLTLSSKLLRPAEIYVPGKDAP